MDERYGKAPDKPPTNPAPHTWYVADQRRYCTRCGHVQTKQPGFDGAWQPDPPYAECDAVLPPSSAADIREDEAS